jgi:hypothetical protein
LSQISIVPEIITSNRIKFLNERNAEVKICNKTKFRFISPFEQPFIIYDIFSKRVTKTSDLINIGYEELNRLGLFIYSIPAGRRKWFKSQTTIHILNNKNFTNPYASRLKACPQKLIIQKDIINKKIRIFGMTAYPHLADGGSPWVSYDNKS